MALTYDEFNKKLKKAKPDTRKHEEEKTKNSAYEDLIKKLDYAVPMAKQSNAPKTYGAQLVDDLKKDMSKVRKTRTPESTAPVYAAQNKSEEYGVSLVDALKSDMAGRYKPGLSDRQMAISALSSIHAPTLPGLDNKTFSGKVDEKLYKALADEAQEKANYFSVRAAGSDFDQKDAYGNAYQKYQQDADRYSAMYNVSRSDNSVRNAQERLSSEDKGAVELINQYVGLTSEDGETQLPQADAIMDKLRKMGYSGGKIRQMLQDARTVKSYNDYVAATRRIKQNAKNDWFGQTMLSSAAAPFKALGLVESARGAINDLAGGDRPTNVYSPWFAANNYSNTVRNTVMEDTASKWFKGAKIPKFLGDQTWGEYLYQAGTSTLDSAVNMAVSLGIVKVAGIAGEAANSAVSSTMNWLMGSEVAADNYLQGIQSGKSSLDAIVDGIVEGAIEGITEKYSAETILNSISGTIKSSGGAWKKILSAAVGSSFLSEGSEEVASNWLNRIYGMMNGDETAVEEYRTLVKGGMDEKTALKQVIVERVGEDAASFLAGGISGLAMSAAYTGTAMATNAAGAAISAENERKAAINDRLEEYRRSSSVATSAESSTQAERNEGIESDAESARQAHGVVGTTQDILRNASESDAENSREKSLLKNWQSEMKSRDEMVKQRDSIRSNMEGKSDLDSIADRNRLDILNDRIERSNKKLAVLEVNLGTTIKKTIIREAAQKAKTMNAAIRAAGKSIPKDFSISQNVDVSAVSDTSMKNLNADQMATMLFADTLAKNAPNLKIRVFESAVRDGKYQGENGSYENGVISLDLNAGRITTADRQTIMMRTLSHELTHSFEGTEAYTGLKSFVFSKLDNVDALIQKKMDRAKEAGHSLTRTGAEAEVVADACEEMLQNSSYMEELFQTDRRTWEKIKSWIQNAIQKIRSMYAKMDPTHEEAKVMREYAEDLQRLYDKAFRESVEKFSVSPEQAYSESGTNHTVSDNAEEVEHSLRENDKLMTAAEYVNSKRQLVNSSALDEAAKVRKAIAEILLDPALQDALNLPADVIGNTFFSDSAYGGSEENTTLCPRTLSATAFVDAVSDMMGRPLTVSEQVFVSQELQNLTDKPECLYCYVAADRAAYREYLGSYIQQRDDVISKYKSGKYGDISSHTAEQIDSMTDSQKGNSLYVDFLTVGGKMRKPTKNMASRYNAWIKMAKDGTKLMSASDLTNMNRLMGDLSSEFGAELVPQIKDAMKYAQSASWAKKRVQYVAYNGHILKWSQSKIDGLNAMYGLRMYSFSDFSPAFILENMQMITDASVRGLKMLAYTKELDFVRIFAKTGMNINVSVFGFNYGSEVYENNIIGADWKQAQKLRKENKNVGITFVATNDACLEWALKQPWIDVVIPYHLVRTGAEIASILKYTNYTAESADQKLKVDGKWNGKIASISPAMHNNDMQTYLDACAENDLKPRFWDWIQKHQDLMPYYMKLVNETRQSAADTKPVQPVFNQSAAESSLRDMMRNGGYYQPIGGSVDAMYEQAYAVMEKGEQSGWKHDAAENGQKNIRHQDRESPASDTRSAILSANPSNLTAQERNYLDSYKKTATELSSKAAELARQKELSRTMTGDDRIRAKNRADLLQTQVDRLNETLSSLEEKTEIQKIYAGVKAGMIEQYGQIERGENPSRDYPVPQKTDKNKIVSKTVRTVVEAEATPDDLLPTLDKLTVSGAFSYERISDKDAIEKANSKIQNEGFSRAYVDWAKSVDSGVVTKDNTAMGWALYNQCANSGDVNSAIDILNRMIAHQRNAAQAVQATRILKKLSPDTQLYAAQRSVQSLTEELKNKYGNKAPDLQINEGLAKQFLEAKTDTERDVALRKIYSDIGRQMPSTFIDRWNAWRYLSMLGNLRTHVRNITGNAVFAPVVGVKSAIATVIEYAAWQVGGKTMQRSKGNILSKSGMELVKAAYDQYNDVKAEALGGQKYSEANANEAIEEGRTVFRLRTLEAVRKANTRALDAEDVWFSRPHYAVAMAQYCAANGITADQIRIGENIERAQDYAIKEAQKATYRDSNAFSEFVSGIGKYRGNNKIAKAASVITEGILPFRKTPANILVRGVEYSPIGLLKAISYDAVQVKKGNMTASEMIDGLAAGLTGTGIMALGALLASLGLLVGNGGSDDKKKDLRELQGYQKYSLVLPDGTVYTLDWMAPAALPLFVGVNLFEAYAKSNKEVSFSEILSSVSRVTEPMLNMSCLQSLNDLLSSVSYAKNNGTSFLANFLVSSTTSYLLQAIPTLFGQIERLGEAERMQTFTNNQKGLTNDMQYFVGKISQKLPFEYQQIPYVDAWGRTDGSGDFNARLFENLFSPGYISHAKELPFERELVKIYDETGEDVFPKRPEKYMTVSGERTYFTPDEYVRISQIQGDTQRTVIESIMQKQAFSSLGYGDKASMVEDCYEFSRAYAKTKLGDYNVDGWKKDAIDIYNNGGDVAGYIVGRNSAMYIRSVLNGESAADIFRKAETLGVSEKDAETHIKAAVKTAFENGDFSELQAKNALAKYNISDENEAFWTLEEWKGGDDYAKYDRFETSVSTGKDLKQTISWYQEHGVTAETLSKRVTGLYKEQYRSATNAERSIIKARALTAYAALGYDRQAKSKAIDKWLED